MPRRPIRTLLAAGLVTLALQPASALTTQPTPHAALPLAGHGPATGLTEVPASFAAGATPAAAHPVRLHFDPPPAPTAGSQPALAFGEWSELLPDAGSTPALLLGLAAIAGALLRMAHGRN